MYIFHFNNTQNEITIIINAIVIKMLWIKLKSGTIRSRALFLIVFMNHFRRWSRVWREVLFTTVKISPFPESRIRRSVSNLSRIIDLCNKLRANSWPCHKTVQFQRLSVWVRNRCNLEAMNLLPLMLLE